MMPVAGQQFRSWPYFSALLLSIPCVKLVESRRRPLNIGRRPLMDEVQIKGEHRRTVKYGTSTANDHRIGLVLAQYPQDLTKVGLSRAHGANSQQIRCNSPSTRVLPAE